MIKRKFLPDNFFQKGRDFYKSIGKGIWLMDDHRWALVAWDKDRKAEKKYVLAHIDYHWDATYDFFNEPQKEREFINASHSNLIDWVQEDTFIRYDSFICPAIAMGFIDEVHFYCLQGDKDGDIAIDSRLLDRFKCIQVLHNTMNSLRNLKTDKPIIFDFCLDIFNKSDMYYESDIWPEDEISRLLNDCENLVRLADIVTISMSYGHSGTEQDTRRLTEKVINTFWEWR